MKGESLMKRKIAVILICAFLFNLFGVGILWADNDYDNWKKGFIPPGLLKNGKFFNGQLPPPFQHMYNWNGEIPKYFQDILTDYRGEIEGEIVYKTTIGNVDWIVVQDKQELRTFMLNSSGKYSVGDWVEVEYLFNRVVDIEKDTDKSKKEERNTNLLSYELTITPTKIYEGDKLNFQLEVKNNTGKKIATRFNSGQRYDFVVKKDGKKVWRWSDDYDFITVIQNVTFEPGKKETYTAQWTPVDPGNYTVEAYFMGQSSTKPVLAKNFTVLKKQDQYNLQYDLEVITGKPNLYILRVTNPLNRKLEVTTPTGQIYDFLLLKDGKKIWQWSDGRNFTQAVQKLSFAAKETKVYYVQYEATTPGNYQLYGFFKGEGNKSIGPKNFKIE